MTYPKINPTKAKNFSCTPKLKIFPEEAYINRAGGFSFVEPKAVIGGRTKRHATKKEDV